MIILLSLVKCFLEIGNLKVAEEIKQIITSKSILNEICSIQKNYYFILKFLEGQPEKNITFILK